MTANTPEGQRILGTLRTEDGGGVVRIEDRFDADIDEVWAALTETQRLASWYGDVEGELKAGGELHCRVFASGERDADQGRWAALEPVYRALAAKIG